MSAKQSILDENKTTHSSEASEETTKKRGRRKKIVSDADIKKTPSIVKKEGKEEKIVALPMQISAKNKNVILHLRCSLQEIDHYIRSQVWKSDEFHYDPKIPHEIVPYESYPHDYHILETENESNTVESNAYKSTMVCPKCEKEMNNKQSNVDELNDKDIQKIKYLKIQNYTQDIPDKKVDCFWCTYPYDNDPCYILQHGTENNLLAHGSFCSPSCSVAFLFNNMNWDDSSKLESYQLMNYYYGYNSKSEYDNIKPACSPFYTLDKYYGNMTIQEYRKLSKSNYMLICIDKPVSRILPEIHEDNEKMITPQSLRGNYKVKKQSEKSHHGSNRNEILKNTFGV
jgi:hypothetical protein